MWQSETQLACWIHLFSLRLPREGRFDRTPFGFPTGKIIRENLVAIGRSVSVTQPYISSPEPVIANFQNHMHSAWPLFNTQHRGHHHCLPFNILANVPRQTIRTTALLRSSLELSPRHLWALPFSSNHFHRRIDGANPFAAGEMSQHVCRRTSKGGLIQGGGFSNPIKSAINKETMGLLGISQSTMKEPTRFCDCQCSH